MDKIEKGQVWRYLDLTVWVVDVRDSGLVTYRHPACDGEITMADNLFRSLYTLDRAATSQHRGIMAYYASKRPGAYTGD